MKRFVSVLSVSILMIVFAANNAHAQAAPLCDGPICAPDTTATSYAGAFAARSKIPNARGMSNPTVARSVATHVTNDESTNVGSQSYNYVIPILGLAGRAGMDLRLNLYYNSRIWDIDTVNGTATFNA